MAYTPSTVPEHSADDVAYAAHPPISAVILIPSLEPDDHLPAYVTRLKEAGFTRAVIVDDGSSEKYQPIFHQLEAMDGVTVLHHEVNRGKGCALKTGYAHIHQHMPDVDGVITADADGQHTVEDCRKLAEALHENRRALYLGSRDFDLPDVPPKSRFGNKTTSRVFRLFYGQWLPDTQTGLRAFRREDLPFMMNVPGERFEYEMQVLIACSRAKLPMVPITIETVYENENEGTHFHPIRDSWRIYKVILGSFFMFAGASILTTALDEGLLWVFVNLLLLGMPYNKLISQIIARCVSAPVNYLLNAKYAFKGKINRVTLTRYILLAVGILLLQGLLLQGVMEWLKIPDVLVVLVSLVVNTVIYLISYRAQNQWVFAPEKEKK